VPHGRLMIVLSLFAVGVLGMPVLAGGQAAVLGPDQASGQPQAIEATGDVRGGVQVIKNLQAAQLLAGRHFFYFLAGTTANGQPLHVPVMVIKGAREGKKLALTAAVHGDELNGIAVIHQLANSISPEMLSGTLIALPGVNQTGLLAGQRSFQSNNAGGKKTDPNRIFPGTRSGGNMAEQYVGAIWQGLLKNNADLAVDIHSQTTGSNYPLFVFADFRNPKARAMAFALQPDLIKNDKGQKGTLETTFIQMSIPAVTFEVGGPKIFENHLVNRAVKGLKNLMVLEGMLEGSFDTEKPRPFVGSAVTNIKTKEAGTAHVKVKLLDVVEKGQLVAITVDPFGREVRRYFAPHGGRVLSVATDPLSETGSMLVRVLR